jgi:uncharacterized protein (DUF302 family)
MYCFSTTLTAGFDAALVQVADALKAQGFGILTEIDVQATLKAKLGVETRPYRLLGACNPPIAHQVLMTEPEAGVLLPCNVVVRELEDGRVCVDFMDPTAVFQLADNPAIAAIAATAKERLLRAQAALA